MLVLSAPSGAGKTTLSKLILQIDKHIHTSISYTTRKKRPGEVDGKEYHFVSHENFHKMTEEKKFLEYAKVFNEYYATPHEQVEAMLNNGKDVLFDIEWQGNRQLNEKAKEDVVSIFILPPSKKELRRRLEIRAQDHEDTINYRMACANEEIRHWHEYDYTIINHDIDESIRKILCILRAERLKKSRRLGVADFVTHMLQEKDS